MFGLTTLSSAVFSSSPPVCPEPWPGVSESSVRPVLLTIMASQGDGKLCFGGCVEGDLILKIGNQGERMEKSWMVVGYKIR